MKSKMAVPIISVILVAISILSGVLAVYITKNKKVQLSESDVTISDIVVDGGNMKATITSANSLGIKITDNTYSIENGKLVFKLYGKKDINIGEPLKDNQVVTLFIRTDDYIDKVVFSYLNSDGEEKETEKAFTRGVLN